MHDLSETVFIVYAIGIATALAFAAWRDIVTRTIPDTVSVILALIGAGTRLTQGVEPFAVSLLCAVVVFVVLIPLCTRGILGGADLKLLTALAAGLAPHAFLMLIVYVTIVGGVLALLYLSTGKVLSALMLKPNSTTRADSLLSRIVSIEFWRIRRRSPVPYGVAIAIGAGFAVLNLQGV